ncbi:MAG: DUF6602 domain-containing protein [Dehalococcoidia bacterium]
MPRGSTKPSAVFEKVLNEAAEDLKLAAGKASSWEHRGIVGDERAAALRVFLEKHLPSTLGVAKGEVIDHSDERTGQLDLIIYDRAAAAAVEVGGENLLLPCEAVYAVIEVKSTLTLDEMRMAYKSAAKLRKLRPFGQSLVGWRPNGIDAADKQHRILYVVFAFGSNLSKEGWLSKEYDRIVDAAAGVPGSEDLVDRVVVLDRGLIAPPGGTGKAESNNQSIFFDAYFHLVNFISREQARRPAIDWQLYAPERSSGWKTLRADAQSKRLHTRGRAAASRAAKSSAKGAPSTVAKPSGKGGGRPSPSTTRRAPTTTARTNRAPSAKSPRRRGTR